MKIGIITFHFPWNCGAALQCIALQQYLKSQGHDVCVIDYSPLYHANRYSEYKHPLFLARRAAQGAGENAGLGTKVKKAGIAYLKTVKSWTRHKNFAVQARKFKAFQQEHFNLTKPYRSIEELRADPPKCDLYVSGSDQLWNAKITDNGFDAAYFMDFGPKETGRVTYSIGAEFAGVKFPQSKLIHLVDKIDAIALREEKYLPTVKGACEYINQGDKPLALTIDPTLLLSQDFYGELATQGRLCDEPYVFVYTMPSKVQVMANNVAKKQASRKEIHVVDASGNPNIENKKMPDSRICDPSEFLAYIRDAEYVVTSSFHGTVFSIIFNKPFVAIPHPETGNRITELLNNLGLSDRVAYSVGEALDILENPISYDECTERLKELRQGSFDYLSMCIEEFGNK